LIPALIGALNKSMLQTYMFMIIAPLSLLQIILLYKSGYRYQNKVLNFRLQLLNVTKFLPETILIIGIYCKLNGLATDNQQEITFF